MVINKRDAHSQQGDGKAGRGRPPAEPALGEIAIFTATASPDSRWASLQVPLVFVAGSFGSDLPMGPLNTAALVVNLS